MARAHRKIHGNGARPIIYILMFLKCFCGVPSYVQCVIFSDPYEGGHCTSLAQTMSPTGDSEVQLSCLGTPRCFRALQARIPYASGCYGNAKRKSLDSHRKVKTKSELAGPLLSSTAATRRPDNFTAHNINSTSSHYIWVGHPSTRKC